MVAAPPIRPTCRVGQGLGLGSGLGLGLGFASCSVRLGLTDLTERKAHTGSADLQISSPQVRRGGQVIESR